MRAFSESRLRGLVADTLGVGPEDLRPDVSLTDDLAADSLDIAELVVRLETELGIVLPERMVDSMRTYGDLLRATRGRRRPVLPVVASVDGTICARLVSPGGELVQSELLTPYTAETITDAALRASRGARLEILVPASAADDDLAHVHRRFAWLREHGIELTVGREEPRRSKAA